MKSLGVSVTDNRRLGSAASGRRCEAHPQENRQTVNSKLVSRRGEISPCFLREQSVEADKATHRGV